MKGLRTSDVPGLLEAISDLYSSAEPEGLSARTLTAVQRAVSCDFICFDSFGGEGSLYYLDTKWDNDAAVLTVERQAEFGRLFNAAPEDHPNVRILERPPLEVVGFYDHVSEREFGRTPLFNEFFRKIDLVHQLSVMVSDDQGAKITCSVNRRRKHFVEHDRLMLSLLAPHLANAIRTSIELRKLQEQQTRLEHALEVSSRGLVGISPEGRVTDATERGLYLLMKHFKWNAAANSILPDELRNWLRSAGTAKPEVPLSYSPYFVRSEGCELRIDPIMDRSAERVTLLLHERSSGAPLVQTCGLSRREAEVLNWIADGKTDEVIGMMLGISTRTVQKHVEHIFHKLAVETRTAAVSKIRDVAADRLVAGREGH